MRCQRTASEGAREGGERVVVVFENQLSTTLVDAFKFDRYLSRE